MIVLPNFIFEISSLKVISRNIILYSHPLGYFNNVLFEYISGEASLSYTRMVALSCSLFQCISLTSVLKANKLLHSKTFNFFLLF